MAALRYSSLAPLITLNVIGDRNLEASLTLVGVILILAALIGGNVQGGGVNIPPLRNPFVRVVVGAFGIALLLSTQSVQIGELLSVEVECSEKDDCQGVPIACKVSDENPDETIVGNIWTYASGSAKYDTRSILVSDIRFGPWKNPQCGISTPQKGWSEKSGHVGREKEMGVRDVQQLGLNKP